MLAKLRYLTSGESHGKGLLGILDGIPAGLEISESEISSSLEKSRLAIKEHRKSRIAPGTDDKIIVSWNGLMISSLAKVSAFLDDKEYFEIADRAVSFIVYKISSHKVITSFLCQE